MKKVIVKIFGLLLMFFVFFIGFNSCSLFEKEVISNLNFADMSVTYDGKEHALNVTGMLPEGVTVEYYNNNHINAGKYEVVAVINDTTGKYEVPSPLTATLTINKAKIENLLFESKEVIYDGKEHKVEVTGTLPSGVSVTYYNNNQIDAGKYEVVAVIKDTTGNFEVPSPLTATLTINKAKIENLLFESKEVIYDSKEHKVEITGTLPSGVSVTYYNNNQIDAGKYEVMAVFNDTTGNFEVPSPLTATLTINKAKVALPEITTNFIYDGQAKVPVSENELYTIEEGIATNAGNYTAIITLKDTTNYEWEETFNGMVDWVVEKATYNMNGVEFKDATVKYDGKEHKVEVTGTLPSGVTVSYENNQGTNAGTYNAVAKFAYDAKNYNEIPNMKAVLVIYVSGITLDLEDAKSANPTVSYSDSVKPGYGAGVVTLGNPKANWLLDNALIDGQANDRTDGEYAIRAKAGARIEIQQDGEYNAVEFDAAIYGNDTLGMQIKVEYSLDSGATWVVDDELVTVSTKELETFRFTLPEGVKRIALVVVPETGNRVNIDNIQLLF